MHERPRAGLGPYQPAVKRKDIGATFPAATARPAPTPTVARRLGGVAYGSGRYGEKESRRARAGEKFYFVRTEVSALFRVWLHVHTWCEVCLRNT